MIISLLSFHVVSEIRSCWKNLQPVFLEILGWCDHCIIYNSEPYLKDLFFSWIHLRGQSLGGAWLRLSGGLENQDFLNCGEQSFHLLAQAVPRECRVSGAQHQNTTFWILTRHPWLLLQQCWSLENLCWVTLWEITDRRVWTWSESPLANDNGVWFWSQILM